MRAQLLMTLKHPVVRAHRVDDQHILPGLAYIDLLYQVFRNHGMDCASLQLRHLTIHQPLVISPTENVLLEVECVEGPPGQWRIDVQGVEQRGGRATGEPRRYARAQMIRAEPCAFEERIDPQELARSAKRTLDLQELYGGWRQLGVNHAEFMRAQGRLYVTESAIYIDCSVGELGGAAKLLFHPALIDGSVVCGAGALSLETDSGDDPSRPPQLGLPLFFESFRACVPLQRRCIARLRRASCRQKHDLSYCTLEFFNEQGLQIAELRDLATKLVRNRAAFGRSPAPRRSTPGAAAESGAQPTDAGTGAGAESFLRQLIADWTGVAIGQIDPRLDYYELGVDSAGLLELAHKLEARVGETLPPTLLFEYVTIEQLAEYLSRRFQDTFALEPARGTAAGASPALPPEGSIRAGRQGGGGARALDIAIIGMSGRFPSSENVEEFWENLKSGTDCITEIPAERWDHSQYFDARPRTPGKTHCRWGGFVRFSDALDYEFFGLATEEAGGQLDRREKLLLEVVRDLMGRCGYTPDLLQSRYEGCVGLYLGAFDSAGPGVSWTNTTISDSLRLAGPGITVDSQSSSSMTALHLACQAIVGGDCDAAIVASAFLLSPEVLVRLSDVLGSSIECRCFSKSDGLILSEGAAAIMLRPLADAERDGDQILAVIKGTAINRGPGIALGRDAANRSGPATARAHPLTKMHAQADVVRRAFLRADVDPLSISYVEAALSGHPLFDGIALSALKQAFEPHRARDWSCTLGSVESNVGHGVAVSALTQVVKTVLQLRNRAIIPSIRATAESSECGLEDSGFRVSRSLTSWERPMTGEGASARQYPRRALVTSYGAGGMNGCAIVQEYEPSASVGSS